MFNRRYLRIKVFQTLYAYFLEEQPDRTASEKRLINQLSKTYELYVFVLSFFLELKSYADREWEDMQHSAFMNEQRRNSISLLKNNRILLRLENSDTLQKAISNYKIKWKDSVDTCKKFLLEIRNSESFGETFASANDSAGSQRDLFMLMVEFALTESEIVASVLDDKYANLEDDEEMVLLALHKSSDALSKGMDILYSFHKDEEADLEFVRLLYRTTLNENPNLEQRIATKTKNWDSERLALCDMILMKMAVCEWMFFPSIPVKVTLNEYIEIAKLYSTPSSHSFINGVLDKIQSELRHEQLIHKTGRGLVE